jgi:hypothetical protein
MKKTKLKRNNGKWCRVEIELDAGRLSICGSYGEIITAKKGKATAKEYWRSFFEDSPEELGAMQQRFPNTCLHTPKQGAAFVVKTDGEFHGLDISKREGDLLLIEHGGGQCVDEIAQWFPEVAPYLKYHLNDMNAACEHQEALGWHSCQGYHKEGETCAEPQRLPMAIIASCGNPFDGGGKCKQRPWKEAHRIDDDGLTVPPVCPSCGRRAQWRGPFPWGRVRAVLSVEIRPEGDRHCDFDAMSAPCPECGYRYGTAWLKRELPPEVITWFESFA